MDIKTTILLFALVCALAAFFVMWAKWEEEKAKTREERENYLSAKQLHNTVCGLLERSEDQQKCSADAVMWYAEMLMDTKKERDALQDRLSALLCPHNDHVWKDGVCVKCGRVQDV